VSRLKSSGYGDGRTDGAMPGGGFMWREHNGKSGSGIVVDGVAYQLAGQPPIATSHGWGDLSWWMWHRRSGGVPRTGS
jgi:hypothetical protein